MSSGSRGGGAGVFRTLTVGSPYARGRPYAVREMPAPPPRRSHRTGSRGNRTSGELPSVRLAGMESTLAAPSQSESSDSPIVKATGLERVYGEGQAEVRALDGVDVSFEKGRFTSIMGPSGSGKSTVLRIMAGADKEFDGEVQRLPNIRVGYLPQEPQLISSYGVSTSISTGLRQCGHRICSPRDPERCLRVGVKSVVASASDRKGVGVWSCMTLASRVFEATYLNRHCPRSALDCQVTRFLAKSRPLWIRLHRDDKSCIVFQSIGKDRKSVV